MNKSNISQRTGRRILHTMLRVGDMRRSIDFYTRVLGMRVLRQYENVSDKYRLCFMGYEEESCGTVVELTYNEGIDRYAMGEGYGHMAIEVDDCFQACAELWSLGAKVNTPPVRLDGMDEIIAFVEDPDGYSIELVQRL